MIELTIGTVVGLMALLHGGGEPQVGHPLS